MEKIKKNRCCVEIFVGRQRFLDMTWEEFGAIEKAIVKGEGYLFYDKITKRYFLINEKTFLYAYDSGKEIV